MRDATKKNRTWTDDMIISIHASHAGCDDRMSKGAIGVDISIHASHAGCDTNTDKDMTAYLIFQSTHPMRDATLRGKQWLVKRKHFNPRIPCGMRL